MNYDDDLYITRNPHIQSGLTGEGIKWAFSNGLFTFYHSDYWNPLAYLSHMIVIELFGLNPSIHHLVNLAIHLLNTLVLFGVLAKMTNAPWRSAFVAAIFAVHPLHVESVAWVIERKDLLSTLFFLLALKAYQSYTEDFRLTRYLLVMAAFAMGLMSKPMVITLPLVLLLLDFWPLNRVAFSGLRIPGGWRSVRGPVLEKIPLFVLAGAAGLFTFISVNAGGSVNSLDQLPMTARVSNAIVSYAAYLQKTVWPTGLAVFYPHPGNSTSGWAIAGSGLVLLAISALSVWLVRSRPYLLTGWCWYLGTLVPVIGILQVGRQAMADRFTYIPLIGIFIMVAWGIPDALEKWRFRPFVLVPAAVGVVAALAACTWVQAGYWKNNTTLFEHALRVTKGNFLAHNILGATLSAQGKTDEAIAHLTEAVSLRPDSDKARNNLGIALEQKGELPEAILQFRAGLRLNPGDAALHYNLGRALDGSERDEEAAREYRSAIDLQPEFPDAHYNLAGVYRRLGRLEEAVGEYRTVLKQQPAAADAHNNIGLIFASQGRLDDAVSEYERAIGINPDFSRAYANLGAALAKKGDLESAANAYGNAVRLNPDAAAPHFNLAVIQARRKRYEEAMSEFRTVVNIDPMDFEAHLRLGDLLAGTGAIADAKKEYETALRIKPDFEPARRAIQALGVGNRRPGSK